MDGGVIASTAEAGKNSIGNQFAGNMANGLLAGGTAALSGLAGGDIAGALADDSTGSAAAEEQAGKNAAENNLLGGDEETQTRFVQEYGKNIASCSTEPGLVSWQRGLAIQDALMVALAAGLGGSVLGAGTPEIAAAAKATIQACTGGVALCLNNAGIMTLHAIVPGGAIGVGIGKIVVEASLAKTVFNNVKDDLTVSLTVGASWNFRHLAKQGGVQENLAL